MGPKLLPDVKSELDFPITQEEIGQAILQMAQNKSLGPDGIPIDWYKMFYSRIKNLLREVFNEAYKCGRLHSSAERGIITLLPRKRKRYSSFETHGD